MAERSMFSRRFPRWLLISALAIAAAAARFALDPGLRNDGDLKDPENQAAIDRDLALAGALRITGMPGIVVGKWIPRGVTDLKTLQFLIGETGVAPQ